MSEIDDLPLDPSPELPGRSPDRAPLWPWVVALVIVGAVTLGFVYQRLALAPPAAPQAPPEGASATPAESPAVPAAPRVQAPEAEPLDLPPLDRSDTAVRPLIRALSSQPEFVAWLATDGLIRQLAVCIENVSDGKSPGAHLKVLRPLTGFRATANGQRYATESASFARYDWVARLISDLDMASVARLYGQLRPRLDEAYQDLGHEAGDIDVAVTQAIDHLLATPDLPADTPLRRAVVSYRYVDQDLEHRSAAQKHLMRMGPANVSAVKAGLRKLAGSLGLGTARPPASHR